MNVQFRYSVYYFLVTLSFGVTLAFFPLHCKNLGFTSFQIAVASAAANLATVIGAPLFTLVSTRFISSRRLVFGCSLASCIGYLPLLWIERFEFVLPIWFIVLILNAASTVLVDTRAVRDSVEGHIRYETARMWGSIGFILSLALIGRVVDLFGLSSIIRLGLLFAISTHLAIYLIRLRLPALPTKALLSQDDSTKSPGKSLALLLVIVALIWASHGAYYVYFSIYLRSLGWSGVWTALAWNVGVVAEIILFILFKNLRRRFNLFSMLRFSAGVTVLRWLLLAFTAQSWVIIAAQGLHAFSFGLVFLSAINLVQELCPPSAKEKGQGYLSGFGSGGGSLLGRVIFGYLAGFIPLSQDFYLLFWPAAFLGFLAFLLSLAFRPSTAKLAADAT